MIITSRETQLKGNSSANILRKYKMYRYPFWQYFILGLLLSWIEETSTEDETFWSNFTCVNIFGTRVAQKRKIILKWSPAKCLLLHICINVWLLIILALFFLSLLKRRKGFFSSLFLDTTSLCSCELNNRL